MAADMMRAVAGPSGEIVVTIAIVVAAVSTLNATIFTGSRVFYAMAQDLPSELVDQLGPGGVLVAPVASVMVAVRKDPDGRITSSNHGFYSFVPLIP